MPFRLKNRLLYIVVVAAIACSCATAQTRWANENCNRDAAFAAGFSAGRESEAFNLKLYQLNCLDEFKSKVTSAYREGYQSGVKSNSKTTLEQHALPGMSFKSDPSNFSTKSAKSGAWICAVNAFAEHFEVVSETEEQARVEVTQECTEHNHLLHCRDVACVRQR